MRKNHLSLKGTAPFYATLLAVLTSALLSSGSIAQSPIDTAAPYYLSSGLGTTVLPDFKGGTLLIDEHGASYAQAFLVENYLTNTIDMNGNTTTFSGAFTGPGPLNLVGSGTIVMKGTNSFTGKTTIETGTLFLSGSGSIRGDVVNNGSLEFFRSNSLIYAGNISGTGTVRVDLNPLTLTGTNTYTGTTFVDNNTKLQIGAGGTQGSIGGPIKLWIATLDFNRSGIIKYSEKISGAGYLVQEGQGTLILTGDSDFGAEVVSGYCGVGARAIPCAWFKGNTTIASGSTLQLGDGGTTGMITGDIVNNGTLGFNHSDNVTFAGNISGSGGISQLGTGTLTLTGTNSSNGPVTVSAGTLIFSAAGSLGTGTINITGGTLQYGAGNTADISGRLAPLGAGGGSIDFGANNVTFASPLTGTGGFTKLGSGNLILSGTQTYTGTTTISGGTLSVNGSLAGPVAVASGGKLGGNGTTGAVTVASGGNLAPGNSIGTIDVASLSLAAGSTYTVEISPTAADRVNVTGAASLNGTLALVPATGTYAATTYRLIQAGSLTGTFGTVTGAVSGFTNTVQYSATAVDLILTAPVTPVAPAVPAITTFLFGTYGNTPNQIAAGNGLAAASSTGALYTDMGALVGSNVAAVPAALGLLAGDIRPSLRAAAIDDSRVIRNVLLDHMNRDVTGTVVWGAGFGGYGSIATDGNASALHHASGGFLAGVDFAVLPNLRLGIDAGYSSNSARTTGRLSTASGDQGHIGAYAAFSADQVSLNLGGDYGFGKVNIARAISQLGQVNSGLQDQQTVQVFADLGYLFPLEGATLQPHVTLAHIIATSGSFTETGGTSALLGAQQSDSLTFATFGLRAALLDFKVDEYDLIPRLDLGWQHALSHMTPGQTVTYQNAGTSFLVLGAPLAQDAAAVQAGVELKAGALSLFLAYDCALASSTDSHGFRGGLNWRF